MTHVPGRKAVTGPALIRLLAHLTDAGLPESEPSLADRLCQWLRWTDAIALSSALGALPPAPTSAPGDAAPDQTPDALCQRVRASLTNAVTRHATLTPQRPPRGDARARRDVAAAPCIAPDYSAFRQCYLALQEQMETAIGNLRALLRGMLASRGSAMSQLASLDAVMERVLGIREHNALAAAPGLLAVRFERLRDAQIAAASADAPGGTTDAAHQPVAAAGHAEQSPAVPDGPWLDAFRKDMQSVLLAELEIRFQPVEGLRAALRDC